MHVENNTRNVESLSNKKQFPKDCSDKVKIVVLNNDVEFVCPTCQTWVFSANHDACIAQFIKNRKSSVKTQSTKTPNRN